MFWWWRQHQIPWPPSQELPHLEKTPCRQSSLFPFLGQQCGREPAPWENQAVLFPISDSRFPEKPWSVSNTTIHRTQRNQYKPLSMCLDSHWVPWGPPSSLDSGKAHLSCWMVPDCKCSKLISTICQRLSVSYLLSGKVQYLSFLTEWSTIWSLISKFCQHSTTLHIDMSCNVLFKLYALLQSREHQSNISCDKLTRAAGIC